ncbi:MAG: NYN domain-containing protein [Cyanophyceae cyanobacterium]
MSDRSSRIALLIDADNAPAAKFQPILTELSKDGVTNIRRAYGNWKNATLQKWEQILHEYAIQPVQQFDLTKGKNATDMALVIDAMDLLHEEKFDILAIVSSDCDFTPLVMRVLANGVRVYGFGEQKTPAPFVNACSRFLDLNALGEELEDAPKTEKGGQPPIRKTGREMKGDAKLIKLLRGAIDNAQGEDGWADLGTMGQFISNQASFDSRNYGYRKLLDLVNAIDLFEVRRQGLQVFVRDRRANP